MTFTRVTEACINAKYFVAQDLLTNSCKDPEGEPYKSKYQAQKILTEVEQHLLHLPLNQCNRTKVKFRLAAVCYLIGSIYYDVEEPVQGEAYALEAIDVLGEGGLHPSGIICYVSCLNLCGYAACKYDRIEESLERLEKAEYAYELFKGKFAYALGFGALFGKPDQDEANGLEKCHTQTLFYLAQVYSVKGMRLKAAKYCHTTLERQLEMREFDSIEWSLNSATLSQYLIEQNAFKEARAHLAVAQLVLEQYKEDLDTRNDDNEELKALKESLRHRRADVFRCWAKYGIYLLNASKERLMTSEGDTLNPVPLPPVELRGLGFQGFEDEIIQEYESAVACNFILTFDDAKPVFLKSQEWLNMAKEYYSLEDLASDHTSILQDSSQLYALLAFFQQDEAIQCKLHKRRLDLLDKAVNELNPVYYLKACRELWYELGEISVIIADLKKSQAESTANTHFLQKSQHHFSQGIQYFEKYLKTYKIKNRSGEIEKFPDGYERNIITAYMYLGRMYSKLTSQDKEELLRNQADSLQCYLTVLEYCNTYPEIKDEFSEELGICREMSELLPLKILKIERYM